MRKNGWRKARESTGILWFRGLLASDVSNRATTATIVAPFCALCNEIANDMISAFGDDMLEVLSTCPIYFSEQIEWMCKS